MQRIVKTLFQIIYENIKTYNPTKESYCKCDNYKSKQFREIQLLNNKVENKLKLTVCVVCAH